MKRPFLVGFLAGVGFLVLAGAALGLWVLLVGTAAKTSYETASLSPVPEAPMAEPSAAPMEELSKRDERPMPKPSAAKRKMAMPAAPPAQAVGGGQIYGGLLDRADDEGEKNELKEAFEGSDQPGGAEGGAATRAWFPETFLFEPLVVTDAQGRASVPVKVPDRLTTWRVLALAHGREGTQAGAVTSFLGTLPTYVDPVVPPFLLAGDEVRLPVQLVNTTTSDVNAPLGMSAANATLSSSGGSVRVPAEGSTVQYVTLKANRPGTAAFKATLGATDAIERTIDVKPQGRRVVVGEGGTLGAPRELEVEGPADAIAGTERVRLQVFPGALALVRSELSAAIGRGGVFEDAYTLLLAGRASGLLRSLGGEPDAEAIRQVTLIGAQRALRHGRAADVAQASTLAEAALAHPDNVVLARLGERLAAQVASKQRPDGTCLGGDGWTLQRLLVATADCVRAVQAAQTTQQQKNRAVVTTVRAKAAFERNLGRVEDPYTAAALLSTGALSGDAAQGLSKLVKDALVKQADGSFALPVPKGVVRPDGLVPSQLEATALAALALDGQADAPLADLGGHLLGHYSPLWGWGDGRTNLMALRAVVGIFKTPVPENVTITVMKDGAKLTSGAFDAKQLKDVLTIDVPADGAGGKHRWKLEASPPVAGLGFALAVEAYVPWKNEPSPGLELAVTVPPKLQVGLPAALQLVAAAPAGTPTMLRLSLPAGVVPDVPSLEALVSRGSVSHYDSEDGAITLHLVAMQGGAAFTGTVNVVPTLGGTLHASANTFGPENDPSRTRAFAPATWVVK